jgi:hypothetical protein
MLAVDGKIAVGGKVRFVSDGLRQRARERRHAAIEQAALCLFAERAMK